MLKLQNLSIQESIEEKKINLAFERLVEYVKREQERLKKGMKEQLSTIRTLLKKEQESVKQDLAIYMHRNKKIESLLQIPVTNNEGCSQRTQNIYTLTQTLLDKPKSHNINTLCIEMQYSKIWKEACNTHVAEIIIRYQ